MNIDLGKLPEDSVPQANTTRHRVTISKGDANMFDLDLPDEDTQVQRAKVS
jgi:hypothetical protein